MEFRENTICRFKALRIVVRVSRVELKTVFCFTKALNGFKGMDLKLFILLVSHKFELLCKFL